MAGHSSRNTFLLVRHGEAETNVLNVVNSGNDGHVYRLTDRGRRQIGETAAFLKAQAPHFIIASPVARALESAEIIRAVVDVPLTVDARLTEAGFGIFENKSIQSFLEFMRERGGRTVGEPERGIEGYMDIRERVRSFLADIEQNFSGQKIVIVSHGDTLQELSAELQHIPVGPSQDPAHNWLPQKGACLVVTAEGTAEFVPEVD